MREDELPDAEVDLARVLLRVRDELRHRLHRQVVLHDHHLPALAQAGERREVLHRVVGELLVEVLVGRVRGVGGDEHRVAVRGRPWRRSCAAIMPLAPGLLSTTTDCFVSFVIACPTARASVSVALPAAKGTTKVIDFVGNSCAPAAAAASASGKCGDGSLHGFLRGFLVAGSGAVRDERDERFGNLHGQVEHEEGERLAVRIEVERIVHAAVEHVVEDEVHGVQVRQQVARDLARARGARRPSPPPPPSPGRRARPRTRGDRRSR